MEYSYTAIILKKREIGETDRLYVLYTREAGKVSAVGRGVRKPSAKLAGQLETFNRGAVMVARSKGMGNITGAVSEWSGLALKGDADGLAMVFDAMKVFDRMVGGEERDAKLFDLVRDYLEAMELSIIEKKERTVRRILTQAFLFQVFARLGYRLETAVSLATGEPLRASERYGLSIAEGGLIEWEYAILKQGVIPIGNDAIKLLRLFFSQRLASLVKVRVNDAALAETQSGLDALTRWVAP
ncbi:MAG: DNA repair protein RecO [Candidatus Moraniibacteriota bacterium]